MESKNIVFALALFWILLLAIGCTQQGTQPSANATNASVNHSVAAPAGATITSADVAPIENPDSDSTDPGIPLEDI